MLSVRVNVSVSVNVVNPRFRSADRHYQHFVEEEAALLGSKGEAWVTRTRNGQLVVSKLTLHHRQLHLVGGTATRHIFSSNGEALRHRDGEDVAVASSIPRTGTERERSLAVDGECRRGGQAILSTCSKFCTLIGSVSILRLPASVVSRKRCVGYVAAPLAVVTALSVTVVKRLMEQGTVRCRLNGCGVVRVIGIVAALFVQRQRNGAVVIDRHLLDAHVQR